MKRILCLVIAAGFTGLAGAQNSSYSAITKGRYLAAAGDCAACHTADGGRPYAGGRPIPTPFGTLYSTNITPDKETGIGNWSAEDFYRAMHQGIRPDGQHLYPAFPYPWYTRMSREDVEAIKAFLDALAPVKQANRENELPWPLSIRASVGAWNLLFFKEGAYRPDPRKSAEWNRGAYLVEGPGHCSACHSPKNLLGGLKREAHLQGGYGEHWYATSLTGSVRDGLGAWSVQDIVEFLKTGSNAKAAAVGPMAEVVGNSTQHLDRADLQAIATYLKDLPAHDAQAAAPASGSERLARGEALYLDQCAGCHMRNGEGQREAFPPLKGNAVVQAADPGAMLHMILDGARVVATREKPTGLAMPAFGWKLSDADAADLATYLRGAWGNRAGPVDAGKVKDTRERIAQSAR